MEQASRLLAPRDNAAKLKENRAGETPAYFEKRVVMAKSKSDRKPTNQTTLQQTRLWLMYPPKLITEPLIWKLGHKFKVVTNVRQASVTDEIGIVCLELDGARSEVKAAIKWLVKNGVSVEPVEISVVES